MTKNFFPSEQWLDPDIFAKAIQQVSSTAKAMGCRLTQVSEAMKQAVICGLDLSSLSEIEDAVVSLDDHNEEIEYYNMTEFK